MVEILWYLKNVQINSFCELVLVFSSDLNQTSAEKLSGVSGVHNYKKVKNLIDVHDGTPKRSKWALPLY